MKKIYLLLVNGLLITSAVGVTALTVAGCKDEDKDKDKDKKVADNVEKALEEFEKTALEIDYLKGHDTDSTSLPVVRDEIRKKLAGASTVLTDEIVKKIEFNNKLLVPGEEVTVGATYTGDKKIHVDIKVKESYGTEFVKKKLVPYTKDKESALQVGYTDDTARAASSPEATGKIKEALRHVGLTSGLLKGITFSNTVITPGTPVEITLSYPGASDAKI